MNKGALVVGGSAAGLQAALDLADSGIDVHLIDSSPFLGNTGAAAIPAHLFQLRMLEVTKHPRISIRTNTRLQNARGRAGSFRVRLQQSPRFVDLAKCTGCGDCVKACPVMIPGTERKAIYLIEGVQPGCAAIEKSGKAPCTAVCPGGIQVQGYVALIAQGRFQEALALIREAIPLAGIIGRICTHPCELNCRRSEVDAPVSIRLLKRFAADWELNHAPKPETLKTHSHPIRTNAQKVAVIGSGPAGMTAADRLARWGYRVTVFEKLPVMAGMLAIGIPAYRLPREVIDYEYRRIEALGVEIRLGTTIGSNGDYTLDDLFKAGYEAVCLAIGAHKSLMLGIPGEKLPGVIGGLELLKTINLSQRGNPAAYKAALKSLLPRGARTRALVLGGGNTAMDVARTLRRVGVENVCVVYRRTRAEMPALPEEIDHTLKEGIPIAFLTAPTRISGDARSGVTGLACIRMKLAEPDDSGRRRPVPIRGSEFEMPSDMVVVAIGQVPDLAGLESEDRIKISRDQRIEVNRTTFATRRAGVFAVGDAVTPDKMSAIEAIGMGKKAAAEIHAYLKGSTPAKDSVVAGETPVAHRQMSAMELLPKPRVAVPNLAMQKRRVSFAEVELGYSPEQAMTEAQRCLVCGPCSECFACVKACGPEAVLHYMPATITDLHIGAIIWADDPAHAPEGLPESSQGVYRVAPQDSLMGSAAAAHSMSHLAQEGRLKPLPIFQIPALDPARMGVFICECGHLISEVVHTEALRRRAATWLGVAHAQVMPFSCAPEAAAAIRKKVLELDLNRIVLGACACCSLNQACYSCTYQRVRCKANLGLFKFGENHFIQKDLMEAGFLPPQAVEFVNIREQCAWIHQDNRQTATQKAGALLAAAAAKLRMLSAKPLEPAPADRSVLILGGSDAARYCQELLLKQNTAAQHIEKPPFQIRRADSRYAVIQNAKTWTAEAVVLAPRDTLELLSLEAAFGAGRYRPRLQPHWGGVETHRPGIFYCDSSPDAHSCGAAAAARVSAWLGRIAQGPAIIAASVDRQRCRACNTCIDICELEAPQLIGQEPHRTCRIDPVICKGCGACAANCPSGAIRDGYASDEQLEAMIDAVLK